MNQDSLESFTNRLTVSIQVDWITIARTENPTDLYQKLRDLVLLSQTALSYLTKLCEAPELKSAFGF